MEKIILVNGLTCWSESVIIEKEDTKAFYIVNALGNKEIFSKENWYISPTYEITGGVNRYWKVDTERPYETGSLDRPDSIVPSSKIGPVQKHCYEFCNNEVVGQCQNCPHLVCSSHSHTTIGGRLCDECFFTGDDEELTPADITAIDQALAQPDMGPYTIQELEAMVAAAFTWNGLQSAPSYVERVGKTPEPITLTEDECLDTVLGEQVWMPQLRKTMDAKHPWSVVVVSSLHRPLIWLHRTSEDVYQCASDEVNKPTTKAVVIFHEVYSTKPHLFYLKPHCHECNILLTQDNQAGLLQCCKACHETKLARV